ncbi:MAG: hypothetical protein LBJ78_03400 [Puniceicoccales bacterium]|jgi:hypothetical protein|nr:hypothetical protein [Puniceicoccales bacterium]
MTLKYLLKTISVLASGLALQAHAVNTQNASKSLEGMLSKKSLDVFAVEELFLEDTQPNRKSSGDSPASKPVSKPASKTSLDDVWGVNEQPFNEEDPW